MRGRIRCAFTSTQPTEHIETNFNSLSKSVYHRGYTWLRRTRGQSFALVKVMIVDRSSFEIAAFSTIFGFQNKMRKENVFSIFLSFKLHDVNACIDVYAI